MIGSDARLTPGGASFQSKPVSASLAVPQPKYISDDTTESAVNNTLAKGYRTPRLQARAGFSNSSGTRYQQALNDSQSLQAATGQAATIRSEDQRTNSAMRAQHQAMMDTERLRRQSHDLQVDSLLYGLNNARSQTDLNRSLGNERAYQNFRFNVLGRLL